MARTRLRIPLGLPKRPKYGNRKTVIDGIAFDSAKEARRYQELLLQQKAGLVRNLERQPAYSIVVNDQSIALYRADFRYETIGVIVAPHMGARAVPVWDLVVEDVKGVRTPVYQLKKKLVEALYGIQIREV